MVKFFEKNPKCRVVIVEKTDRLYRNFRDCVTLEDLEVEIHLPKEGQIIGKESKSQSLATTSSATTQPRKRNAPSYSTALPQSVSILTKPIWISWTAPSQPNSGNA